MRPRVEMLTDANWARMGYAHLTNPEDMLVIRLARDVTDLLAALAEKDTKIKWLRRAVKNGRAARILQMDIIDALESKNADLRAELAEKDAEIERLKNVEDAATKFLNAVDKYIAPLSIVRAAGMSMAFGDEGLNLSKVLEVKG